jgi:hypothetical protein
VDRNYLCEDKTFKACKKKSKIIWNSCVNYNEYNLEKRIIEGTNEIIENIKQFKLPLKIIVSLKDDIAMIMTCYLHNAIITCAYRASEQNRPRSEEGEE